MTSDIARYQRSLLSKVDLALLDELESAAQHLDAAAMKAYQLGMHEEAELLDEACTEVWAELEWAASEIREGGDLDVFGQEAESSTYELFAKAYAEHLERKRHVATKKDLANHLRSVAGYEPKFRKSTKDKVLVEAAKDAYENRKRFWDRMAKLAAEEAIANPASWVKDEKLWARAEEQVAPYWDNYDEPWAVVAFVYKRMLAAKERKARSARARKAAKARWSKRK